MIKGIGIDIVELERIEESIKRNDRLINRILTISEKKRYEKLSTHKRRVEYLSGRFAAKEACAKALETGIGRISFQDIEITNKETGAPAIHVRGFEKMRFFLSISHSDAYAVAQVVVEVGR